MISKFNAINWPKTHMQREQGLTLLELMVALALGGFLVLGVVNVFLTTKESATVEASLARVQESGRFALDVLSDDIRRAHYTGCNSVNATIVSLVKGFEYAGLRGYRKSGSGWLPALDPNDPALDSTDLAGARDGTDMLNLHTAEHIGNDLLTADVLPSSTSMDVEDNPECKIQDNDRVIISNCLTSHVFHATVTPECTSYTPGVKVATTLALDAAYNDTGSISPGYIYTAKTELMKFESVVWFVADTGRNRNGMDVHALYRKANDSDPEEMIEGVEFMEIHFGQRGGSGANPTTRFVAGNDVNLDWDEVVSVRVALLIQNYDRVRDVDDTRDYVLLDPNSPIGPAEHGGGRALRQVFKITTALRNTDYDT